MSEKPSSETPMSVGDGRSPQPDALTARLRRLISKSRRGRAVLALAVWYLLAFVVFRDGIRYAVLSREIAQIASEESASVCYVYVEGLRDPSPRLLTSLRRGPMPVAEGSREPPLTPEGWVPGLSEEDAPGWSLMVSRITPILPFVAAVDSLGGAGGHGVIWHRSIVVGVAPFWVVVYTKGGGAV
jgi:hypothetical protein